MHQPVVRGGESGQYMIRRLLRHGEGPAVDGAAVLGERNGLHPILCKDMHIVRPQRTGVGAAGGIGVVVTGRDHRLAPERAQRGGHQPCGVAAHGVAVKQVACQQQKLHLVVVGPVHQTLHALPALGPALAGLLRRQRAEGAVQMEVACMQDAYHHASPSCQPLHTSTHWTKFFPQQCSSSSQVSSMALAALPTAGNTVSNRFRDTSR